MSASETTSLVQVARADEHGSPDSSLHIADHQSTSHPPEGIPPTSETSEIALPWLWRPPRRDLRADRLLPRGSEDGRVHDSSGCAVQAPRAAPRPPSLGRFHGGETSDDGQQVLGLESAAQVSDARQGIGRQIKSTSKIAAVGNTVTPAGFVVVDADAATSHRL